MLKKKASHLALLGVATLKKKASHLALLGVATLPVVTMLCAARPARADTYWYPLTGSTWYLNQLGSDWYDKDILSTANSIPPGNGSSVAIIGDFGSDGSGPSNTNVTYDYSYGATGIGTLEIDNGNTLTQSANYAMVAGSEKLGDDGTGTYSQSAGSNTFSDILLVGNVSGSQNAGNYFLSGGTLTGAGTASEGIGAGPTAGTFSQSGGTNTIGGGLQVGGSAGSSGGYLLNGSTSNLSAAYELIGYQGSGNFTQFDGTNTTSILTIATTGSSASYSLYGGTLNGGAVTLGTNGGFSQIGGTFDFTSFSQTGGTSSFIPTFIDLFSGQSASVSGGTFSASKVDVGPGATFTQTGGTLSVSAFIQIGGTVSLSSGINLAATTYNLSGGALSLPSFSRSASSNQLNWTNGGITLTSQAFDVTSATSDSIYGGYVYGGSLILSDGMSLNITGGTYPQENVYGNGSYISQKRNSSNTTTNLYVGSTGSSAAQYILNDGSLTVTGNAYVGYNLGEGGSGYSGTVSQVGGTAQYGSLTLGVAGAGTYQLQGGSATVTNATNLDAGASLQIQGGSFTTGSFFGPGSDLSFTGGTLTLTSQNFDVTTTTDPTYNGFIYGSALTLNNGMSLVESGSASSLALFGSGSTITQATGSSVSALYLFMGDTGTGATTVQYNLNGGALTVLGEADVGYALYTGPGAAAFTQSGGTSSFKTLDIGVAAQAQSAGSFTLSAGTMTVSSAINLSNGTFHQSGGTLTFPAFNQSGGTANFDNGLVLTSSTYALSGGALTTASITGPGSHLTWTSGSLTLSNQAFEVTTATTDPSLNGFIYGSTLTLNNGMSLTVPSSGTYPEEFVYGNGSSITQNTGSTNSTDELLMGSTGTGTPSAVQYTLNGGTLTAAVTVLGYNTVYTGPAAANFTQTGGTVVSGATDIGQNGVGTYSLSGGTAGLGNLYVGVFTGGSGTLTVSGSGAATASTLTIGNANNAAGVVNLGTDATSGGNGSLTVGSIAGGSSTGGKSFYFNGGTLVASGNSTAFISGLSNAYVSDGGGVINNNGHTITIDQPLLHAGNGATDGGLTSTGSGTLTLSGSNTYTGATSVNSGTFTLAAGASLATSSLLANSSGSVANINGSLTGAPGVTASAAGVVNFAANTGNGILLRALGSLTIRSNGHVNVLPSTSVATRTLLTTSAFTFNGTSTNRSELDLANNDMVVHGGSISTIQGLVDAGYNNGAENGVGIISSTASANSRHLTTLGYRIGGVAFDGISTNSSDVLVKYTYYGDADLNGSVNGADYQQIDSGFGSTFTGWQNGDFNYDGVVNGSDFALIDNTFNQITATGAGSLAVVGNPLALVGGAVSAAVPEPAAFMLLGMMGFAIVRRRR